MSTRLALTNNSEHGEWSINHTRVFELISSERCEKLNGLPISNARAFSRAVFKLLALKMQSIEYHDLPHWLWAHDPALSLTIIELCLRAGLCMDLIVVLTWFAEDSNPTTIAKAELCVDEPIQPRRSLQSQDRAPNREPDLVHECLISLCDPIFSQSYATTFLSVSCKCNFRETVFQHCWLFYKQRPRTKINIFHTIRDKVQSYLDTTADGSRVAVSRVVICDHATKRFIATCS